jgi:hypothetical protein
MKEQIWSARVRLMPGTFVITTSAGNFTNHVSAATGVPGGEEEPGEEPQIGVYATEGEIPTTATTVQFGSSGTESSFFVANTGTGTLKWFASKEEIDKIPDRLKISTTGGNVGSTPIP